LIVQDTSGHSASTAGLLSGPSNQLKALIFDLDGTLYPQRPVRMAVLRRLIFSHLCHPISGFRTFRALAAYRRSQELLRDSKFPRSTLREAQLQTASLLSGFPSEFVAGCVSNWMEEQPLKILHQHLRKDLIRVLKSAKEKGIRTAVCSDYPAPRKIAALGLTDWFDLTVSAQDPEVGEFKPSPRILQFALERLGVQPWQALYIGDRSEIDGVAAKRAGVACHILRRREDLYQCLLMKTAGYRQVPIA
jgi:HAD superfamily hydrolase (TIGR01549 family)